MVDASSVKQNSIEDLKKQVYDNLFDSITDALLHGNATIRDSKESAQFILGKLDEVKTKQELLQFLFDLSTKWTLYHPYYVKIKYSVAEEEDTKKIQELKSKLYQFIKPS